MAVDGNASGSSMFDCGDSGGDVVSNGGKCRGCSGIEWDLPNRCDEREWIPDKMQLSSTSKIVRSEEV